VFVQSNVSEGRIRWETLPHRYLEIHIHAFNKEAQRNKLVEL
jgi:hypothetical protein